jgi:hypothetical protein
MRATITFHTRSFYDGVLNHVDGSIERLDPAGNVLCQVARVAGKVGTFRGFKIFIATGKLVLGLTANWQDLPSVCVFY